MKLVTFETERRRHVGALRPGEHEIVDLTHADPDAFSDMLTLIDGGEQALAQAAAALANPRRVIELETVRLLAPVPEPRQMFDCACFPEHLKNAFRRSNTVYDGEALMEIGDDIPSVFRELPVYYKCNRLSVIGTDDTIVRPRYSRNIDYELEFGVFLSAKGKNWTPDEAGAAIFGYCIFNDVSARDKQMSEMRGMLGPSKGKDFDTGNVMGPWLVTKDEIPDPQALQMRSWINGELMSDGTSAGMMYSFAEVVAYASQDETRWPGEFFGSGTVGGGSGIEHGRLLADGDFLELEVEGLGRQRSRVVFQPEDASPPRVAGPDRQQAHPRS